MIQVEIPGYGFLRLANLVSDFSGTLSEDGRLFRGLKQKLNELSVHLNIHILTSDTFGRAEEQLEGVNCTLHILDGKNHSLQKEKYVLSLGSENVAALGNGNNDSRMLKAAKLGICVCLREGCSVESLKASKIFVRSPVEAVDLFLHPKRLIATLRK